MGVEIERKFTVLNDEWRGRADGMRCRQAYLCSGSRCVLRVRIINETALLTVKGRRSGLSRPEFEYEIPVEDAISLIEDCAESAVIHKTRYKVPHAGKTWEIDVFHGYNEGLVIAEIELDHESEEFVLPGWTGQDVSKHRRFSNHNLSRHPYCEWSDEEKSCAE